MFIRKAAIRPVPGYALVDEAAIDSLEGSLGIERDGLQGSLDEGFRMLDRTQPALARYLAEAVSLGGDELVQSLGYFLVVSVYLAFREAFPTRLAQIDESGLAIATDLLTADEALRADDPLEVLDSDDVIALGQPHVLQFVQHHVQEALSQSEADVELSELDSVYRTVLVEVLALSAAVEAPRGHVDRALA